MYCIGAQINDKPGVVFTNAGGEAKMIEDFVDFIQDVDPDIITGYNSNGFDIPKIMEKCRSLNVDFGIFNYCDAFAIAFNLCAGVDPSDLPIASILFTIAVASTFASDGDIFLLKDFCSFVK